MFADPEVNKQKRNRTSSIVRFWAGADKPVSICGKNFFGNFFKMATIYRDCVILIFEKWAIPSIFFLFVEFSV